MAKLIYGHLEINGNRINYYRTGGQLPPVVYLHDLADSGLCWNRLPVYMEPFYDQVLIDARGHGMSGKPENGYSTADHASDVIEVIHALKLEPVILIGHAMGSAVAALTARLAPDLVRLVILEDPPWLEKAVSDNPNLISAQVAAMRQWITGVKSMTFEEIMAFGKGNFPNWDQSEFFQWAKSKQMVKLEALDWLTDPQPDWRETINQIRCPGLLITSDPERGAVVSPATTAEAKTYWKKLDSVHLPGAGHHIHREQYYAFRDLVRKYIKAKVGQ